MKKYKIEISVEAEQITVEQVDKVSRFVFNGFTEIPFYVSKVGGYLTKNPENPNVNPINIPEVQIYKLIKPELEE